MEIDLDKLTELVADYLQAARSIPIQNPQERQGNSKLWEKDLENYFHGRVISNAMMTRVPISVSL